MNPKFMLFVLLGPQGSGKGTQAEYLEDHFSIPTFSVGAGLREEAKKKTRAGKEIRAIMAKGMLVPNEYSVGLVKKRMKAKDAKRGLIIDGFPRDLDQAKALEAVAPASAAIIIEIRDKESIERLANRLVCETCGMNYNTKTRKPVVKGICDKDGGKLKHRADDEPLAIKKRLEIYHKETEPVIALYKKMKKALFIEGEQPIIEVHEDIVAGLKEQFAIEKVRKTTKKKK